jgi:uncharacterized protein (TIGR02246 family)
MKLRRMAVLLALSCVAAGCKQTGSFLQADQAALRTDTEQWNRLANAADWARLAALYTDNAVLLPPNGAMVRGRASIQTWMAAFPKIQTISAQVQEIDGRGDLAYVRGTYTLNLAQQGEVPPVKDVGKYVEIHRKQPDGSWSIALDIFNSDVPLAVPTPLKTAAPARGRRPRR